MSKFRSELVCETALFEVAKKLDLGSHIRLGKGEESTGGRKRPSLTSDALEALIGGIYLDGGLDAAAAFIRQFILNDIEHKKLFYDSKTILQEVVQREYPGEELVYRIIGEYGPAHDRHFEAEAVIGSKTLGRGRGSAKKSAEMEAAYRALIELKQRGIHVS